MLSYPPESLMPLQLPTAGALRRAAGSREIFRAVCVKCDEFHNLIVDLGPLRGVIPREEAALSSGGREPREIAVLSRVGKPVCFQVLGFASDGTALLSRRAAQEEALAALFSCLTPGEILTAAVVNPTSFGAFCDIGCGVTALLGIDRCSVSRISHCAERFSPGQAIYAAVLSLEPETRRIFLTHRELLGTWAENAALFRPGQTVTGIVRGVKSYGVFVELTPNLTGLAEPNDAVSPGDSVSVYIRSILPEKMKIKLTVLERLASSAVRRPPLRYFLTGGSADRWHYSDPVSTP